MSSPLSSHSRLSSEADFSETDGRILGTLAAALLAGSTLIAGLALVERGGRRLGMAAVAVSVPAFALLVYSIWDFVFDGGGDSWRWGWAGALALLAALIAVTARLLARTPTIERLGMPPPASWRRRLRPCRSPRSGERTLATLLGKTLAALWILTGLAYFLVPVLQRFSAAGVPASAERVLGEVDGIELVATHSREGTIEPRLEPGERLALTRRA